MDRRRDGSERAGAPPGGPPGGYRRAAERRAVRQGLGLLAALAVLGTTIFFVEEMIQWWERGPELVVLVSDASGLEPGANVWIAGIPSGRVTGVRLRPLTFPPDRRVVVHARLVEGAARFLRAGTTARVRAPLPLEPPVLALAPGPPGAPPLDLSDTLSATPQISVEDVMALADSARRDLDSLRATRERLAEHLETSPGLLGVIRRDPTLRAQLERSLAGLRDLSDAVLANRDLRDFLQADAGGSLRTSMTRLSAAGDSLARRRPALEAVDAELSALRSRLDNMDRRLASGRGSAGRFLHDGELEEQLRLLRHRLQETRAHLMEDPLSWLRIRLF